MQVRVIDQIDKHLPQRTRVAIHGDSAGNVHLDAVAIALQTRAQGVQHLLGHLAQVKTPALLARLICCHLLEVFDQIDGAVQVALDQVAALHHLHHKACKVGLLELPRVHYHGKTLGQIRTSTGCNQAVAQRGVELMRHAGHQRTQACLSCAAGQGVLRCLQDAVLCVFAFRDIQVGGHHAAVRRRSAGYLQRLSV